MVCIQASDFFGDCRAISFASKSLTAVYFDFWERELIVEGFFRKLI